MDLTELFGEANLKMLGLAAAEDAKAHLAAGHPLRAAFSAAHHVVIARQRAWSDADQARMTEALEDEIASRLRAADDTTAAWRAGYRVMLTGTVPWSDPELARLIQAVTPRPDLRPWKRLWFAGQAADYHLLTGGVFWDEGQLALMLTAVRDDFGLRLRNGDKLMAADRVVLYMVLGKSLGT
jgi:hypothetical protein